MCTTNKELACDILAFNGSKNYLPVLSKFTEQNWECFLTFIRRNNLLPLIYSKLWECKDEVTIPSRIMNEIRKYCLNISARSLTLSYDIKRLLSIMNANKFDAMMLKGAYIAEKYYENSALRPMCDIDVLIKRKDLDKILELLLSNGYVIKKVGNDSVQRFHLPTLVTKSGNSIELHADIYQTRFFAWRNSFDVSLVWSMVKKEKLYGMEVFYLPLEYNIVYLCTKIVTDNFRGKLLQIYDIALILSKSEINWNKLYEVAAELDSLKDVFCIFHFAKKLYQVNIPSSVLQRFKPADFGDTQDNYIMHNLFSCDDVDGEFLAAQLAVGKNIFLKIFNVLNIKNIYFLKEENASMIKKINLIAKRLIYLFLNHKASMKALFTRPNTDAYNFHKWISKH